MGSYIIGILASVPLEMLAIALFIVIRRATKGLTFYEVVEGLNEAAKCIVMMIKKIANK
jgi:cyanate lyase